MVEKKCISTKRSISNDEGSVVFPCPKCGNEIVRSREARQKFASYECPNCGFTGP
ncbi:MAG: zinc finger domain-containing protein [Nanobdellota archaeon]